MTLDQFARAAAFLKEHGIALRVFILVKPPWLDDAEAEHWALRSLEFAFECQASVSVLIPVRPGNGALESLAAHGEFAPPKLVTLEAVIEQGLARKRGRVFADLWDIARPAACPRRRRPGAR